MDAILENIYKQTRDIGQCGLFRGTENIEELIALFRSPQGEEFCLEHGFPNLETWRNVAREYDLKKFGIYVDAGCVSLTNEPHVTLVGDTTASLRYNNLKYHDVILMHGAHANVVAEMWAVVFVQNDKLSDYTKKQKDNSKIL